MCRETQDSIHKECLGYYVRRFRKKRTKCDLEKFGRPILLCTDFQYDEIIERCSSLRKEYFLLLRSSMKIDLTNFALLYKHESLPQINVKNFKAKYGHLVEV